MIVKVLLPLILAFIMFSLGLGLKKADFTRVVQFPTAFGVGLCNQLFLLPVIAFALVKAFNLSGELAVGMMILSFCPGGVTTNVLARLSKGNVPLSISMTAFTSLASILTVPFLVALSVRHFLGAEALAVNVGKLGITMFLITAVPVLLGMLVTKMAPGFTKTASKPISLIAIGLFCLMIVAALAKNWDVVAKHFPTLGPALITLNITLLAVGFLSSRLAKLDTKDASTISIESGIQNGTLGIAVGALIAAGTAETLPPTTVPSAVYGVSMYLVSIPFVIWRAKTNRSSD